MYICTHFSNNTFCNQCKHLKGVEKINYKHSSSFKESIGITFIEHFLLVVEYLEDNQKEKHSFLYIHLYYIAVYLWVAEG